MQSPMISKIKRKENNIKFLHLSELNSFKIQMPTFLPELI